MPAKRSAMRKIKDVLRLKFEAKLSHERIAAATGISKGAVSNYVQRALLNGLGWPLPAELDEGRLEGLLFRQNAPREHYAAPDFAHVHQELKRKGVTLQLLWEEYRAAQGERAYRYSQYCEHYHRYRGSLVRSMRQVHRAGEKLFIDYSGDTAAVIDMATGEVRAAQIFVAVMGASKYAYAEATWTQTLPDWIASNIRALEFMNGAPALLIPDNLKSAIKNACRYEPEATSTYEDFARHYGTAILPARPFRPKDKAAVEMSVLVVQRWILARLRNRSGCGFISHRRFRSEVIRTPYIGVRTGCGRRPSPGARLPRVFGVAQSVQNLWRGTSGGSMPARAEHRLPHRKAHQDDPSCQTRPAPRYVPRRGNGGRLSNCHCTTARVPGPIFCPQFKSRPGVHFRCFWCDFGMCSGSVVNLPS
jgi:transposase